MIHSFFQLFFFWLIFTNPVNFFFLFLSTKLIKNNYKNKKKL